MPPRAPGRTRTEGRTGGGGRGQRGTKGASEAAAAGGKVTWAAAVKPKPVPPCGAGRGERAGPSQGGRPPWCHFLPPPLPAPRARQKGEGGCSPPPSWRPSRDDRTGRDWAAGGAGSGRARRAGPGVNWWRPKVTRVTFAAALAPAAGLAAPPSPAAAVPLSRSRPNAAFSADSRPQARLGQQRLSPLCRPDVFVVIYLSYTCACTSQNQLGL